MDSEITTKRIGSKWHAFIAGRRDVDETALSEAAAREKARRLRQQLGDCGARADRFEGISCALVRGHEPAVGRDIEHRNDSFVWSEPRPGPAKQS